MCNITCKTEDRFCQFVSTHSNFGVGADRRIVSNIIQITQKAEEMIHDWVNEKDYYN